MKRTKKLIVSSVCAVILSNCATEKEFVALPHKLQNEIKSTEAFVQETSPKIQTDIENPNLTSRLGGGLIPALIEEAIMAHRQNCAEEATIAIQNDLCSLNLHQKIAEKFSNSFKGANWMNVTSINYEKDLYLEPKSQNSTLNLIKTEAKEAIIQRATTDSILIGKFDYRFNPKMDVIKGTICITIYPTSDHLKKLIKTETSAKTPIFKISVSATESLPQKKADMEENAKIWSQNNSELLKRSLDTIIERTFNDLSIALKNPTNVIGE